MKDYIEEYYPSTKSVKLNWKNLVYKSHDVVLNSTCIIDKDEGTLSIDIIIDDRKYTLELDTDDWIELLTEILNQASYDVKEEE